MSLWRVEQAADYLGIRPKTLYEWVRTGKVPHRKLGFNVRFDPEELACWVVDQGAGVQAVDDDLSDAARDAVRQLRRLETDLAGHLSFPQRRELRQVAARLEQAAAQG